MAKQATKPKAGKEAAANDDTETAGEEAAQHAADKLMRVAKFDPARLNGSVADFLIQDLRVTRGLKPWEKMSQADQEAMISRAERQAAEIVRGRRRGDRVERHRAHARHDRRQRRIR